MSREEIVEHAGYVGDQVKLAAYGRALRQVVRPGDRVLDLGTGTGVLGLLAASAGAAKVYAIDSGSIIATAEAIAASNGLQDRFVFLRESSTRLQLPEPVDVVVGDQIGGMAYDAGVLEYYADAHGRLLRPGGSLVPGSFALHVAPVCAPIWDESVGIWSSQPGGFDMSPMFELAVNTEYRVELDREAFLGPEATWAEVGAAHIEPIKGVAQLTVGRAGRINGLAGMFTAQLCPGVELTNSPLAVDPLNRWQNYYPLREPTDVAEGDLVDVTLDVRPKSYVASWSVRVTTASGDHLTTTRGSTLLGRFLSSSDAARASGIVAPPVSKLLAADRYALELVDGQRTIADIAALVFERHPEALRSNDDARRRVDHLLRRHVQTDPACDILPTD